MPTSSLLDSTFASKDLFIFAYVTFENIIIKTNNTMNYKANLEKALFGELGAVEKYRRIMGAMPNKNSYTLLMSIMTDELRHANKYNFLIHNAK